MATTTLRQTHSASAEYSDLTTSIPGAAGATGFIKHLGGTEVEIVFGGAEEPEATVRGTLLRAGGEEWCESDHIWLRCPHGGAATLGFVAFSE
ncbi:MAG: hypothetical protein AB7E05_14295 [Sphingobium sp.]